MIQRVQSIYLFLAFLVAGVLIFIFSLWTDQSGKEFFFIDAVNSDNIYMVITGALFALSSLLSLVSIFLFKNRKSQVLLNRVNIIINFSLLGIIVYLMQTLPGETSVSEKGIGSFLPLMVILLLVLANKAILKDEKLVKSVDRLR